MPITDPTQNPPTETPVQDAASATAPKEIDESPAVAPAASPEAGRADAVAIAELCQLAGHPERTAAFLAAGVSEAQVRKALMASRADSPEIRSTIAPDASALQPPLATGNPLLAAVKKLTGKE